MKALRVLIVDDHPVIRRGVRQILEDAPWIAEVGEASAESEAIEKARGGGWDAIVLDLGLPGRGGLDVLKAIKAEAPRQPVLILSLHPEEQYAVRALRAGASGYLTKEAAPDLLLDAVRRVARGERYISPTLADRLVVELTHDGSRPVHETLSDREYEVFTRIGAGMTVGEIAEALSLSVKTVSGYRANVLQKTGLGNNAAIMKYVLDHRLLD